MNQNYPLLNTITSPRDVKKLSFEDLDRLAQEIRQFMIQTISQTGGHLASNLGVVELTIALHRVFDLPQDQIVWDVGHQCYTHKILTGRKNQFTTIRQEGGISGFPRPQESVYDAFIGGHSSISISAAEGLAQAKKMQGDDHFVIAVIGDGALTGGEAYEALNNAARANAKLIVILNDNRMSISKNVGGVSKYLTLIRSRPGYLKLKHGVEITLDHTPLVGAKIKKGLIQSKSALKQVIYHSTLFEDFGLVYTGPVDGHNIKALCTMLERAKHMDSPVLIHAETVKGKGYLFAEEAPTQFHGIAQFDVDTGSTSKGTNHNFSSEFGQAIVQMAQKDKKICAVTAAMTEGCGLTQFASTFPKRLFDVGIAEQHALTFSAAMAANGMRPVFAVYSTFLQRAYDQIIHDAAIDNRHIVLAIDRAGIVGDDGETHQGVFDTAFLSAIPNTKMYSPCLFDELPMALNKAMYTDTGVVAVRYPRGGQPNLPQKLQTATTSYAYTGKTGKILLITYGRLFGEAVKASTLLGENGLQADLLRLVQIHPLLDDCVNIALQYDTIVFAEEGVARGGIGEHFLYELYSKGFRGQFALRAIPDAFVAQGTYKNVLKRLGLDALSIAQAATGDATWKKLD